jgi:hypothetical protein
LLHKILDRQWPTRDQPLNVPDRPFDEPHVIGALRRICADCKNRSAPPQSAALIRFAPRFLLSTKRPRTASFIATPPIVARRVLTRHSPRSNKRGFILSGSRRRGRTRRIPRGFILSYATGLKAWSRGVRPLRCSRDCARNEESIFPLHILLAG